MPSYYPEDQQDDIWQSFGMRNPEIYTELKELRAISNIVQELEKLQNKVDTIDKLLTDNTRLRKDIVAASNNYQTFMEDFQTFKNNVWYLIGIFVVVISVLLLFLN